MTFLRGLFKTDKETKLTELIEKNSHTGIYRQQILEKIKNDKLIVGTNKPVSEGRIDSSTLGLKCLTSTSPDNNGFVLLSFVNESCLIARDANAFPFIVDITGIKTLIIESDLKGLVIISENGWVCFTTNELQA